MSTSTSENRFRASMQGETLVMEGPITDTTIYKVLDDFVGVKADIDLSKIICASYSGVLNLLNSLEKCQIEYRFINVPYSVHKTLILTEGREFILNFSGLVATRQLKDVKLITNLIEADCGGGSRTIVIDSDKISLAYRSYTGTQPADLINFFGSWGEKNDKEASFWLDYFGFFESVMVQCQQIATSTTISMIRLLNMLDIRIESFAAAWRTMSIKEDRRGTWDGSKSIEKVASRSDEVLKEIERTVLDSRYLLAEVLLLLRQDINSRDNLCQVMGQLQQYIETQSKSAAIIEDVGCEIGNLLLSFEQFNYVDADLSDGLEGISDETLSKVIEQLGIMNPMAESDVDEAREEILSEANLAKQDVDAGVVMTQSFDLVRQIMEHRKVEVDIILENLCSYKNGEIHWEFLRDMVIDKLTGKMVTDQEKKAFEFYLGYQNIEETNDAKAPGDVLLF